jgi:hypothetical protein
MLLLPLQILPDVCWAYVTSHLQAPQTAHHPRHPLNKGGLTKAVKAIDQAVATLLHSTACHAIGPMIAMLVVSRASH